MQKYNDFREILSEVFSERRAHNPTYSMRAFSRDLDILPSRMSDILNGKQGLSESKAMSILNKLNLSTDIKERFLDLVIAHHSRSKSARQIAKNKLQRVVNTPTLTLTEEQFQNISEWYYFAALELLQIYKRTDQLELVAQNLNLELTLINKVVQRLIELGLIQVHENQFIRVDFFVGTSDGVPSQAIRNFHRQMIEKSLAALNSFNTETRDISSVNLLMSKDDLVEAKKILKEFRREFMSKFQKKESESILYSLNLALFPTQKV